MLSIILPKIDGIDKTDSYGALLPLSRLPRLNVRLFQQAISTSFCENVLRDFIVLPHKRPRLDSKVHSLQTHVLLGYCNFAEWISAHN